MEEYYFLFGLALVFTIFASVHDLLKREVANWLNFSLVAFALSYRLIYGIFYQDLQFILFGIFGFLSFFLIANVLYYGRVFAGGDAKLLMGFGIILPYSNYYDLLFVSFGFLMLLFIIGAFYSLIYSTFLVFKKKKEFYKEFKTNLKNKKGIIILGLILSLFLLTQILFFGEDKIFIFLGALIILIIPIFYIYLLSIEKSCMLIFLSPNKLTEGDWIERDIRVGNKIIKKTVHGLDINDIILLRKYRKSIWVKQGVPFVPAFLISLIITVFFYSILELDFQSLFFYLF